MATWNSDNIILTKLGEQVLSKVQSGVGKLTVSRIVSGAGHVSPAQLYSQTQITDIKQEMSVVKYTTNEQQSVISANLTNTGLEEAYDLYQIGIYVTHPDFTDEVLYLIAQCDSPDHIPLPGDNPVTLSYDLVMAHFGTKEVTINVSEAGHVDVTTFNEFIEKTNTALNRKADLSDIPTTLPANGGNADTLDDKHAYEFSQIVDYGDSPTSTNTVPSSGAITIYRCSNWTNYPDGASDGKGILIVACYKGFGFVGASNMWVRQLYITPHNNYKIWQRVITDTTVGEWTNIADGGNADTVDGKHASDFASSSHTHDDYIPVNMGLNFSTSIKEYAETYKSSEANTEFTWRGFGAPDAPYQNGDWFLHAYKVDNDWIRIVAFDIRKTASYEIAKANGSWGNWKKLADGGNADTVDSKHASDFSQIISFGDTPTDTKTAIGIQGKTTTYWCSAWTDYPATLQDGQGMIIAVNYKGSGTTGTDNILCRQIYINPHDSKIYQRNLNATAVGEWVSISDLGYHFSDRTQITSGDLNTITTQGQFVVLQSTAEDTLANQPWTSSGYYLDVYHRNTDIITQIALRWDGKIALRYLSGETWSDWVLLVDKTMYASSTSTGIVSTGEQHFRGRKFFDDSIFIPNPDFLVGSTLPSADTTRLLIFASSDNSTGNASAWVQNIARAGGNNELFMALRSLTSKKTVTALCARISADGSNYYTYVTNPAQSTQVALRNISSGTSAATTTNCPSGSWYGKHS